MTFNIKNLINFFVTVTLLFKYFGIVKATDNEPISYEVFSEFKHLMMYFNEHLLEAANLNDLVVKNIKPTAVLFGSANLIRGSTTLGSKATSFEGGDDTEMAVALCKAIKNTKELTTDAEKFVKYLEIGTEFMKKVDKNWTDLNDLKTKSKTLQDELVGYLQNNSKIILPFAWYGSKPHATGLIIEKNTNDNSYNLIVVNTGAGLQYHYSQADPNNIYPWIKRLWIEFENIPESVIFSNDNWFLYMFIIMQNDNELRKIESDSGSIPAYFYESILSNFREYGKPADKNDFTKLTSEQRSGSCTLSSMMASYLYYAPDEKTYHYNRVIIGHEMLESFFNNYEKTTDFKKLITDGFDLISRNLFESTASSLAHQTLEYLEKLFPDVFKHAGLLGAERSLWIKEKMHLAIQELEKQDKDQIFALKIIRKTVDLGKRIFSFN